MKIDEMKIDEEGKWLKEINENWRRRKMTKRSKWKLTKKEND